MSQQNMLNQFISHKTNKQASTEHAKSAYVTNIKPKKQAKRLQQKMLNQLMSHTKQTKNKQNKKVSTEHAKSVDVTQNKLKGLNRTC
jgi:hypothetical protein